MFCPSTALSFSCDPLIQYFCRSFRFSSLSVVALLASIWPRMCFGLAAQLGRGRYKQCWHAREHLEKTCDTPTSTHYTTLYLHCIYLCCVFTDLITELQRSTMISTRRGYIRGQQADPDAVVTCKDPSPSGKPDQLAMRINGKDTIYKQRRELCTKNLRTLFLLNLPQ